MTLARTYFEVLCDVPECAATLQVPASMDDSAGSRAKRARDLLLAEGWTKDARGLDQCPIHAPTNSL
jgi:hypothetical protein